MEEEIRKGIKGIDEEWGGDWEWEKWNVYVDEEWEDKVGGKDKMEEDMMDLEYEVRKK